MSRINLYCRDSTRLTRATASDRMLAQIYQQIYQHNVTTTSGYHIDAIIILSPRKLRNKSTYDVVNDREEQDDEYAV